MVQVACPRCLTINRVPEARHGDDPVCGKCHAALLPGVPEALTEENFAAFVRGELPVVVDFWAPWCGPCRAMAPHFERAAARLKGRVRFAKVNTDEAPGLASGFGIRAIPTLVLFRNGAEVKRAAGVVERLAEWIESEDARLGME
jgi:thioredoxin 2